MRRAGWGGSLALTGDAREALEGADYVVVQLRVGGNKARYTDETIPLEFDVIGQETTGPGGFAKALRTVPVVLGARGAHRRDRRAGGVVRRLHRTRPASSRRRLLDAGHHALGLCNVAIGFQRSFASYFGVTPDRVQLEHVGLNHLSWERKVLVDGVDRLPGAARAAGRRAEPPLRRERVGSDRSSSAISARSRATTCTTTTGRRRCWRSSARARRAPRRSWRSRRACSSSTRTRRSTRNPRCWSSAAARSTPTPRPR